MASVKILSKAHVKPKKPIGRRECQLVTFDLPYIAFYYNQKLLIYKGGDSDFDERVKKLEEGLGVVLEEFYQLAGKLGKDEEGVFRVEYDDDMDGVEVAVAAAEEIGIADLIMEEGTEMLKELVPYNGVLNFEGLHRPLLAVQLTKLRDGLAMGLAFNHAILDGSATWHFINSWTEICTGAKTSRPSHSWTAAKPATRARSSPAPPAGLLAAHPPEFGAGIIQKAIEAHDAKAIDARNSEWEASPKIFQWKDAGVNCVAVGSSPRFKGKSGGRSIDVEISLEANAMERLEKDKDFLMEG
ncbi:HXXXD-type acyl-transferase family protein [Actinidia rufa]|uniref:HXXXD-type acyl-transferase family protein n=1 Tax=Actinidia rufa TaxID=165716 RepID=A0A7J0G6Q2_9ERIC|nr:HXXXD-type acyl-transferase family protein [Actinidia rufa]